MPDANKTPIVLAYSGGLDTSFLVPWLKDNYGRPVITVTVDTSKIGVRFEPTGLQFGTASSLKIYYGGANGDLNGDGVANGEDTQIESQLLGLWYREYSNDDWSQVSASQSVDDKSFIYALPHFCEYAVALLEWGVQL